MVYAVDELTRKRDSSGTAPLAAGRTPSHRLDEDALEALVVRAQDGEVDAFESLVRTLQGPVRSFARRMMGDAGLGDDAAQEAFLRMWRGLGRYRSQGRFVAWAFTVARNTCIEHLRREQRTPIPVDDPARSAGMPDVDDPTDRADVRRVVGEAVAALPDVYREVVLMREAGLSYDEIAEAAACPLGTVRSRLHEARRRLADRLAPLLFGGDNDAR